MEIQYGCRSEYGPLELRIQTTDSLNGFMVYVEDPRLEARVVHEHHAQSTLEAAKEDAVLRAGEYFSSLKETTEYVADWRCS